MTDEEAIEGLLREWFGEAGLGGPVPDEIQERWWAKAPELDDALRERWGGHLARARAGELDRWASAAPGALALVVLLDQLGRNCHRDTPDMYAGDERARRIAGEAIERGWHREVGTQQRTFFFLPFMHSEELADQDRSVALYRELLREAPREQSEAVARNLDFAVHHRVIVERFGRFPHRNAILGRESTAEELAFLEEPGSSF